MESISMPGGCACGAVRYSLKAPPMFVHCCYCKDCQRQTGSAFVINGIVETGMIELESGTLATTQMPTESGRGHEIFRCSDCLVPLWSNYGRRPHLRFLRLTTLDDATQFPPDVHIYLRSKLPWVQIPDGAKAFRAYYDTEKVWPPQSLARRYAAAK